MCRGKVAQEPGRWEFFDGLTQLTFLFLRAESCRERLPVAFFSRVCVRPGGPTRDGVPGGAKSDGRFWKSQFGATGAGGPGRGAQEAPGAQSRLLWFAVRWPRVCRARRPLTHYSLTGDGDGVVPCSGVGDRLRLQCAAEIEDAHRRFAVPMSAGDWMCTPR